MKNRVESLIVGAIVDCYDDSEEYVIVYDPQDEHTVSFTAGTVMDLMKLFRLSKM